MASDYICKLISRRKSTGYSLRSSKKLCLRLQAARFSQHLVVEHPATRLRSSGTTYQVKYPPLPLFQILNAMLKHIFLIRRRVFISFILLLLLLIF